MHRLVAELFIENPLNKPYVNHINGIKTDNRAENLEWCTQRENVRHAILNGKTRFRLSEKSGTKIQEEDAIKIKQMLKNGDKVRDIANLFLVEKDYIYRIKYGRIWSEIAS